MIKFLIQLLTFIVSAAILASGTVASLGNSDVAGVVGEIKEVIKETAVPEKPVTPTPGNPDGSTPGNPSEDTPCTKHKDEDLDYVCDVCGAKLDKPASEKTAADAFESLFESYDPDCADINKQLLSNAINSSITNVEGDSADMLSDIADAYINRLYKGIEDVQQSTEGATEEEREQAKKEFAQKEADAFESLTSIVTKTAVDGDQLDEEEILDSVGDIIDSEICLGTVDSIMENEKIADEVKSASSSLSEERKNDIADMINNAKNDSSSSNSKKESLDNLAKLLGITLNP